MTEDDELLDQLHVHGQKFMDLFSLPALGHRKRKRLDSCDKAVKVDCEDGEEWLGFGEQEGELLDRSDSFMADALSCPDVVVFSDSKSMLESDTISADAQMRAFMSSKVSKLSEHTNGTQKIDSTEVDAEDDRTNAQNDALLHRLVHTKLLSGSLDSELNMTPAQRRKAFAGRVLELSGVERLGKGEQAIQKKERNRAAKHIRDGIAKKQKKRDKQRLDEAKNLGNYHPTIKKLFEPSSSAPSFSSRKRERGLRMGAGRFSGGMLTLTQGEINAVQGTALSTRRGSRGKGRGRGQK